MYNIVSSIMSCILFILDQYATYIYRRRTTRGDISYDVMLKAVKEVPINKRSCRGVAADYDIKPTTLRRYCTMNQAKLDGGQEMNIERVGYFNNMQVFRKEQNYLLMASSMYFGLSVQEIKRLAYEYGHKLDVNIPPR